MATLLTNARMHPDLARRIEASVSGKRVRSSRKPRLVMLARIAAVLAVVALVHAVVKVRLREREALARTRADVVQVLRTQAEGVTDRDRSAPRRIGELLVRTSRSFEHDTIAPDARGKLGAILGKPTVYVRAPIGSFASVDGIRAAAATSAPDAFVACLFEPPPSRKERDVFPKARASAAPKHVRRLHDAEVALSFLTPAVIARAEHETDVDALAKLKREIDRAPIDAGKRAARAEVLVAVMDEPGEGPGPTELDGERRHQVRVVVAELADERVLVDVRRVADPSWISIERRPTHARALDACVLAMDVHDSTK